jgi:hypothetical protein
VVIGAPFHPDAARGSGYGPGRAYLFNGSTGAAIAVVQSPNAELGGSFGIAVAGLADTNANGRGDVLVGAPNEDPITDPTAERGRAYIVRY